MGIHLNPGFAQPPQAAGDLGRRRAEILNLALLGSIAVASVATLINVVTVLQNPDLLPMGLVTVGVLLGFLALRRLARAGRQRAATVGVLGTYGATVVYMVILWSTQLPSALLVAALVVVLAAALLGARESLAVAAALMVFYAVTAQLERDDALTPDTDWIGKPLPADGIGYGVVLILLAIVAWVLTRDRGDSVDQLLTGDAPASPLRQLRTRGLSVREIEVVQLVATGLSNDQIARQLFISPRTAQSHVANAIKKAACRNRTELGVLAVREGLVPLTPEDTGQSDESNGIG
jgi:DNA-binding CsgD family transcriptional regulator